MSIPCQSGRQVRVMLTPMRVCCVQVQQQQKDWQALQDQLTPYLDAAGISREQLMWALTVTRSRTFAAPYSPSTFGIQLGWLNNKAGGGGGQQQDQQQQHVMCPLLDLFNHRGDVQVGVGVGVLTVWLCGCTWGLVATKWESRDTWASGGGPDWAS